MEKVKEVLKSFIKFLVIIFSCIMVYATFITGDKGFLIMWLPIGAIIYTIVED